MADVFREVSFRYHDREVTLTPSLALLRRIKARGINNVILANRCVNGGVDIEDLSIVFAMFMEAADETVSEEEAYLFLTSDRLAEIQSFQLAYIQAVLPGVDFGKKPEARAAPAKGAAKKPRK